MRIPVFLSYPKPHWVRQEAFMARLETYLRGRGLEPRTLGVTLRFGINHDSFYQL